MDNIDVTTFIREVKKRPAIWDSRCADYKDRTKKRKAWREICAVFIDGIDNKTESERRQTSQDMRMKWRHIRDNFVRANKKVKESGGVLAHGHAYVNQLSFLCDVLTHRTSDRNSISLIDDNPSEDELLEQSTDIDEIACESILLKRKKSSTIEDKLMLFMEHQQEQLMMLIQEHDCDDLAFFKSLLPMLSQLTSPQKLDFRIGVMQLLSKMNDNKPD